MIDYQFQITDLSQFFRFFSKTYKRLLSFVTAANILANNQFGIRENHSTYMTLLNLVDQNTNELDNKQFSLGILIDSSKAFESLDHEILISKLNYYGVRGTANKWFYSYLEKRKQFVTIDNVSPDTRIIKCGVPQGSILGLLLLILYVNDIANVSVLVKLVLFADDTNMFISDKDLTSLIVKANDELSKLSLSKLSLSFRVKRLSLNVKKTLFHSELRINVCRKMLKYI